MNLNDIIIFEQNLKGQKYEDKLSNYFSLHYEILNSYIHDFNYRIGEIYFDNKEKLYIVITHQVHDEVFYVNLQYDARGNLLQPFLSGTLKEVELDNRTRECTIDKGDMNNLYKKIKRMFMKILYVNPQESIIKLLFYLHNSWEMVMKHWEKH